MWFPPDTNDEPTEVTNNKPLVSQQSYKTTITHHKKYTNNCITIPQMSITKLYKITENKGSQSKLDVQNSPVN